MDNKFIICWFKKDLRISDNPALFAAAKLSNVLPIYIFDNKCPNDFKIGAASQWWLHHSLISLNSSLNNKLNVYLGDPKQIILNLIKKYKNQVTAVYWNRCYDPYSIKADSKIEKALNAEGIDCKSFNGSLLWEPWVILKADGEPYKVFTYFYRKGCLQYQPPRKPINKPEKLTLVKDPNNNCTIKDLLLLPKVFWYKSIEHVWQIGENEAQKKLDNFLYYNLTGYKENRNYPFKPNVSRLSPHLTFGEISPNQIWYSCLAKRELDNDVDHFLSEIAWREFSYYLLYHFPQLPSKNFQSKFDNFQWKDNNKFLIAWQKGQTGYPIVDAGMRELWQTGYIHNRVRMVVASFLIKNLLLDWRHGAKWFWDCLVDADLANNSASWQWVAGCGADAAPYFRVFNPVTQGDKFDFEGKYTKHFVPELISLPNKYLFQPWAAPHEVLRQSKVVLGESYPQPIVDLIESRNYAIKAYKDLAHLKS